MGEEMILEKRGLFYGWYFKCQSDIQTMAIILAFHRSARKRSCSIQIITEERSWTVDFPAEEFRRKGSMISIGKNRKTFKNSCGGNMVRTIHECVACRAKYHFRKDNRTLLALETDKASFEYEYRV